MSDVFSANPISLRDFGAIADQEVQSMQASVRRIRQAAGMVTADGRGAWLASFDRTVGELERFLSTAGQSLEDAKFRAVGAAEQVEDTARALQQRLG